jgi:type VI secretion system protein ImpK
MSRSPGNIDAERSSTWLRKGVATLTKIGRVAVPPQTQPATNPLRDLFSDLIAFVIFFDSVCEQQPPTLSEFREKVIALLNAQEERAKSSGVSVEAFREARFAVLSWVDETVLNSRWPHRYQWQHLMLAYYGTLNAGEEFFRRLNALSSQANDIREIYYLCISLGFQGEYAFGDGIRDLQTLKQRLYKQLCATNGDFRQHYTRLFPEAYQKANVAPKAAPRSNRFWYLVAICAPILLFSVYWLLLYRETERVLKDLDQPTVASPRPIDWSTSLIRELRSNRIPAEETSRGVLITLPTLLFQVNSADLNPQADRTIDNIVEIVKRHAPERSIVVEGHASKEGNPELNKNLSDKRARTVAEAFARSGFRREKISSWGFGSEKPKPGASDAANRRVEIIVLK